MHYLRFFEPRSDSIKESLLCGDQKVVISLTKGFNRSRFHRMNVVLVKSECSTLDQGCVDSRIFHSTGVRLGQH